MVNTSLYKPEREAWRLHTHTRERRELGCHSHRCLRRPCQSSSTWCARCCSHLCTIVPVHTNTQYVTAPLPSSRRTRTQLSNQHAASSCSNDIRRCRCNSDAVHTQRYVAAGSLCGIGCQEEDRARAEEWKHLSAVLLMRRGGGRRWSVDTAW